MMLVSYISLDDIDILISSSVCHKESENIINQKNLNYYSNYNT